MRPSHADIVAAVITRPMPGGHFVGRHEIRSRQRMVHQVDARCIIAVIERERKAASLGEIGLRMHRDHTSIWNLLNNYWPRRKDVLDPILRDAERDLGINPNG